MSAQSGVGFICQSQWFSPFNDEQTAVREERPETFDEFDV